MEHELRAKLISTAERCTRLTEMSEATIGLKAVKDNTVFKRIRGNAGFTIKTYDRLMAFMEKALHENRENAA
jgi:hypothetical protein